MSRDDSRAASPPSPMSGAVPAVRAGRPGWRDPRLWIGIAIVAACVVAGTSLLGSADDTVSVWALDTDLASGAPVTPGDLVARRVHFADAGDLHAYVPTTDQLPADLHLARAVGSGELLPRAAMGAGGAAPDTVEVSIAVDAEDVPPSVAAGSVVDVYVIGSSGQPSGQPSSQGRGDAKAAPGAPVLAAVRVVDAPAGSDSLGTTGKRQLVLAVTDHDARALYALLATLDDPTLTVVRRS